MDAWRGVVMVDHTAWVWNRGLLGLESLSAQRQDILEGVLSKLAPLGFETWSRHLMPVFGDVRTWLGVLPSGFRVFEGVWASARGAAWVLRQAAACVCVSNA